jgi:sugar O-acyltransferase (sialic acid O-acetyltransferase NeuD family)
MYLYGASGHAKVIIDILESNREKIEGLYDDNDALVELSGYPVLGTSQVKSPLIISIGDNKTRKKIAESVSAEFGTAVHPSAIISPRTAIDRGTVVMQGVVIQADSRLGKHCIVNTGATVDHDCRLGDFVHISPNATLCGNVEVGEGSWIGAGAVVVPGVKIGPWSVVGAGAVVIRDVPDNAVVAGVPAKIIKYK